MISHSFFALCNLLCLLPPSNLFKMETLSPDTPLKTLDWLPIVIRIKTKSSPPNTFTTFLPFLWSTYWPCLCLWMYHVLSSPNTFVYISFCTWSASSPAFHWKFLLIHQISFLLSWSYGSFMLLQSCMVSQIPVLYCCRIYQSLQLSIYGIICLPHGTSSSVGAETIFCSADHCIPSANPSAWHIIGTQCYLLNQ